MAHSQLIPNPPSPNEPREARRWEESRRRRKMLYGVWQDELDARLLRALGGIRKEAWGQPDLSSNVFRASVSALSVLYDRPPAVKHDDPGAEGLTRAVQKAGLWSMMQRHQRDTIGLREMLMHVDVLERGAGEPRLVFRPVYPDMVVAIGDALDPTRPVCIREMRLRRDSFGGSKWTWDEWDITDPLAPSCRVLDATTGDFSRDLSKEFLGDAAGQWPARYRRADGTPVLPYVIRHASITGELWDAWELCELVEGSLNCGVLWTFFGHCVRNASWPQRYGINAVIPSAGTDGEGATARDSVVADPAVILLFQTAEGTDSQPVLGQFAQGADPEQLSGSIGIYERRVAAYAGISPADVQRVAGDPRSGFAIALNQEAQREAQRRFEPIFRPADEELLALAGTLMNRVAGTAYPEDDYRIAYQGLPPSPEERAAVREQSDWDIANGQASPIDVYVREHPGATDDDAAGAIVKARIDRMKLDRRVEEAARMLGLVDAPTAVVAAPAPTPPISDPAIPDQQRT